MTPGQKLTRDSEGTYKQCQHPHVPSRNSGVTWGFGYDMKEKDRDKIMADLLRIKVPHDTAYRFAQAYGRKGKKARKWLIDQGLDEKVLSYEQMNHLFFISYQEMKKDARELYSKQGCKDAYGWILTWNNLLQPIRDIIVDLRYRGDWTPKTRKWLAGAVRSNNLEVFAKAMSSRWYWRRVPKDRFRRRKEYLI